MSLANEPGRLVRLCLSLPALWAVAAAFSTAHAQGTATSAAANNAAPVSAATSGAAPLAGRAWEGALGLIVSNGPEYAGSDRRASKLTPGFYVQYGRLSLTNAGGFVTRRNDEVVRGLALDLLRREDLRLSLGLRFDGGRRESTSVDLRGLGDVRATVRARLASSWKPDAHWRLGASWAVDALGRGGGNLGELSVAREQHWNADTTWTAGASLGLAGDRYLQTYYGVSAEQSARSGLRRFEPGSGLHNATVFINQRTELSRHWVWLAGAHASQLLGDTRDSPLVKQSSGLSINTALAYSF